MSGKVVSWAMEQHTGSPAAKLVLVKLADNCGEEGYCWPSIELIVEHTELGQSTVYKHLTALEELGLFHTVDHKIGDSVMKGFQLHLPGWEEAILRRGKGKGAILRGGKASLSAGEGVPGDGKTIPRAGIHIEEPSLEPSIEPSLEPSMALVRAIPAIDEVHQAFDLYDAKAKEMGWGRCDKRTARRITNLKKRLKDAGGIEGWNAALARAAASDWCNGLVPPTGNYKQFLNNIDFMLQESSFVKLMEGRYDNSKGGRAPLKGLDSMARGIMRGLERA